MNYLRSAAVLAVSGSIIALAGCSADVQDGGRPQTEITTGVETKAFSDGVLESYCPKYEKDPREGVWAQVQATRVAKYIFGGNDPFNYDDTDAVTGRPVGDSPELGPYGELKPNLADSRCYAAVKCWRQIHDSLYPTCSTSKDAQALKRGSTCPAADSSVTGGGGTKACELEAELFTVHVGPSVAMPFEECVEGLDYCYEQGSGVSGFIYVQSPGSVYGKGGRDDRPSIATDPEPANLGAYLGGTTGATAAATYVTTGVPTKVTLWPGTWTAGAVPAGAPCSTTAMAAGTTTTKMIQANGAYRRCL